jgi:hypothetical protein
VINVNSNYATSPRNSLLFKRRIGVRMGFASLFDTSMDLTHPHLPCAYPPACGYPDTVTQAWDNCPMKPLLHPLTLPLKGRGLLFKFAENFACATIAFSRAKK